MFLSTYYVFWNVFDYTACNQCISCDIQYISIHFAQPEFYNLPNMYLPTYYCIFCPSRVLWDGVLVAESHGAAWHKRVQLFFFFKLAQQPQQVSRSCISQGHRKICELSASHLRASKKNLRVIASHLPVRVSRQENGNLLSNSLRQFFLLSQPFSDYFISNVLLKISESNPKVC
jgi:hypothetical protein